MRAQRWSFPLNRLVAGLAVLLLACGCGKDAEKPNPNPPGQNGPKGKNGAKGKEEGDGKKEPEHPDKARAEAALATLKGILQGELLDNYQEEVKLPGGKCTLTLGPSKQVKSELESGKGKAPLVGTISFGLQGEPADPARKGKTEPHLDVEVRYVFKDGRWAFQSAPYTLSESIPQEGGKEADEVTGTLDQATFPRLFELLSKAGAAP
jgi:hypothetical protein